MSTTLVNAAPAVLEFDGGRSEELTVRKLEIGPLYRFMRHARDHDSPALVALCVEKPAEFLTGVIPKSFARLARQCIELNFPQALDLIADDPVAGALMSPLLAEMAMAAIATDNPALKEAIAKAKAQIPGPQSNGSSSAPAPSGSATETGTAS